LKARLLPCPPAILPAVAAALGRSEEAARLTGSLQVDTSRIRSELAWMPSRTLAAGMAETARWYRNTVLRDR
jgi:UDP-glucose 4-epimerase